MTSQARDSPPTKLKAVSKRLEELDAVLVRLYGLVEKSATPLPVIQQLIDEREDLLMRGTIATKLLTALKAQRRRKTISPDFYERKQRDLMEELREVDEALTSQSSEVAQVLQQ
jgi:hypothetical protein